MQQTTALCRSAITNALKQHPRLVVFKRCTSLEIGDGNRWVNSVSLADKSSGLPLAVCLAYV